MHFLGIRSKVKNHHISEAGVSFEIQFLFGPHFDLYQSLNRLPIWNSQNCSIFPLAFVAGWLQGHWWGFISRNYVVWPTFFLMNVFIALKGSHFWFYIWSVYQDIGWRTHFLHMAANYRLRKACLAVSENNFTEILLRLNWNVLMMNNPYMYGRVSWLQNACYKLYGRNFQAPNVVFGI